jgi:hypothetical protein
VVVIRTLRVKVVAVAPHPLLAVILHLLVTIVVIEAVIVTRCWRKSAVGGRRILACPYRP